MFLSQNTTKAELFEPVLALMVIIIDMKKIRMEASHQFFISGGEWGNCTYTDK